MGLFYIPDEAEMMPVMVLALQPRTGSAAICASMLDNLGQDYVRTARAIKGLKEKARSCANAAHQ
jgi:ABC-type dipeptide/oligopeptide/nickel transport system permease component